MFRGRSLTPGINAEMQLQTQTQTQIWEMFGLDEEQGRAGQAAK